MHGSQGVWKVTVTGNCNELGNTSKVPSNRLDKSNILAFLFRSCSLEELGPETDNVVLAFKQLGREFGEKFNKQFNTDI